MTDSDPDEPVTVTDKRRIDPETGEVRDSVPAPAPSGPVPEPDTADTADAADVDAAEVAELRATLQRVKAEYDNYRKRTMRDQQMLVDRAKAGVLAELLPILDDLERARSHGDLESGPFKAVADKLSSAVTSAGLSPFGEVGEEFDPALHEAVQHEGDGSNPVIGHVMRPGYLVGDQVVRHAMVGVVDTVADDSEDVADTPDNADVSEQQAAESDTAAE